MRRRTQATDLDGALDRCLSDLQTGRATLAACLGQYLEHATELEPLLRAALRFMRAPRVSLPLSAREKLEAQLRTRMAQLPARSTVSGGRSRPLALRLAWLATGLALAAFLGAGIVAASASSLPGDALYSVKRWSESVAVQFAGDAARFDARLEQAQRRLAEFQALAGRGDAPVALLAEFESAMRAVTESGRALAEPLRSQSLSRAAGLSQSALDAVTSVRVSLPQAARPQIDAALARLASIHEGVVLLLAVSPAPDVPATRTPPASATPRPTRTRRPGETATSAAPGLPGGATRTGAPTLTGQGTPGGGLTQTPSGQGTPGGGLTRTPRPTPPGQGTPGGGLTQTPSGQGTPKSPPAPQEPRPTHEPKPTKGN